MFDGIASDLHLPIPEMERVYQIPVIGVKNGYQSPPKYPHCDQVCGYDLYRERSKVTKCGQSMRLYERHLELYGKTFEEQFFNERVINTM